MKNVSVEVLIGPDIPRSEWKIVVDGVNYVQKTDHVLIEISLDGVDLILGNPSEVIREESKGECHESD